MKQCDNHFDCGSMSGRDSTDDRTCGDADEGGPLAYTLADHSSEPEAADTIELCLTGQISPQVAVARLLIDGASAEQIIALVKRRWADPRSARWQSLVALLDGRTEELNRLALEIATNGDDRELFADKPEGGVARIAAFFDQAVAHSPEASVALHSLGDVRILSAATAEIVAWLEAEGLLAAGADVLDLGCGIGRLASVLGQRSRSVLGLDVSAGMVAEARRRCAGLENVCIKMTTGQDLAALASNAFDLVLAVDSFPYVVQLGASTADRHVAGMVRCLRPGGNLVILNVSYRGDLTADRADVARWTAQYSLKIQHSGTSPFTLWDGKAFVMRRACRS